MNTNSIRANRVHVTDVPIIEVHRNTDQEIITITEDKLRLIVQNKIFSMEQRNNWITPFTVLLTLILTFCTAKFEPFLGQNPEFWKSMYALITIVMAIWLIICLKKRKNAITIDDLINNIKNKN